MLRLFFEQGMILLILTVLMLSLRRRHTSHKMYSCGVITSVWTSCNICVTTEVCKPHENDIYSRLQLKSKVNSCCFDAIFLSIVILLLIFLFEMFQTDCRVWIYPYRSSAPLYMCVCTREVCSLGLHVLPYIWNTLLLELEEPINVVPLPPHISGSCKISVSYQKNRKVVNSKYSPQ